MFSNYCFKKSPTVHLPLASKGPKRGRSRSRGAKKGRPNDSLPLQVLWGGNERMPSSTRPRAQSDRTVNFRKRKSNRCQGKKSRLAGGVQKDQNGSGQTQQQPQSAQGTHPRAQSDRTVNFRKGKSNPWQGKKSRLAGGVQKDQGDSCQTQQQPQGAQGANFGSFPPANQETGTDFFNVLYDNVLKSLQNTIEHMVSNQFSGILGRIDKLAADFQQQQIDMKHLNANLMDKIKRQNEANIYHFKFIAQMLVETHTLLCGILNTQRQLSKESRPESPKEERARECEGVQYPVQQEPSSSPDQPQTGPQYQIPEQQDIDTTARQSCQDCADPIAPLPNCRYSWPSTGPGQAQPNAAAEFAWANQH